MQHANGIDFELAELDTADGRTDRLALCLHGFPELNFSWRFQMPLLSARGWRVWAPNMRGYGASSRPEGVEAYRLDTLAADVAALIAHDWGAVVAWHFAIKQLRPLTRLVIMNVPHPMVARRERSNWRQLTMSWYIFFFQLPWLPEFGLAQGGARRIGAAFTGMSVDKARFPAEVTDVYRAAALQPGALTAMINYYRALLKTPDFANFGDGRIETPTLMIWGEEDKALGLWCTEGVEQWVPNLTLQRLPGVSHWVQQEAPERVNALLDDWLARPPAG
ncbi:MAG: alpha/beta fold hydrolase [Sphingomonas sp.]|nr:alpha/beta fold hydrolase [Sphingomonas sp.]